LARELGEIEDLEARARRLVERMALTLQASLMVRHAPRELADAFVTSRLDGERGLAFGTLPRGTAVDPILARAAVAR
ncbi:MAG TPA: DNA alkylation response protein, partial [Polyangia bacterium]